MVSGRVATARSAAQRVDEAYALLPELTRPPAPGRRQRSHRMAALFALGTLLALIGGGTWRALRDPGPAHHLVRAAPLSALEQARYRNAAARGAALQTAPVVLSYHDLSTRPDRGEYIITPEHFAADMAMLRAAGYRTMSAEELGAFLRGERAAPPRAVAITFDDGTAGLYTYADRILQANGFSAISFLISGRVGTHPPYYLTWDQVTAMQRSGRWSFQGHTHDLHTKFADEQGGLRSALTNRMNVDGRAETLDEARRRVESDLDQVFVDFADHGLPRPAFFAWPFSEAADPAKDPAAARQAIDAVAARYSTAFVNHPFTPAVDQRMIGTKLIKRLEVRDRTTTAELFEAIEAAQTIPLDRPIRPTEWARPWIEPSLAVAPMLIDPLHERISIDAHTETQVIAHWAPQATGDWDDYTVEATITAPNGSAAGLIVRAGSPDELQLWVRDRSLTVRAIGVAQPGGGIAAPVAQVALPGAERHRLRILVERERTVIELDGRVAATLPVSGERRGGVGVVFQRDAAPLPWAAIDGLLVTPR